MRDLQLPGRSPARSLNGMAATSHALATVTALNVLQDGGNAMDAWSSVITVPMGRAETSTDSERSTD